MHSGTLPWAHQHPNAFCWQHSILQSRRVNTLTLLVQVLESNWNLTHSQQLLIQNRYMVISHVITSQNEYVLLPRYELGLCCRHVRYTHLFRSLQTPLVVTAQCKTEHTPSYFCVQSVWNARSYNYETLCWGNRLKKVPSTTHEIVRLFLHEEVWKRKLWDLC